MYELETVKNNGTVVNENFASFFEARSAMIDKWVDNCKFTYVYQRTGNKYKTVASWDPELQN